ncbi:MAG: carboxypeptidase-like regulatory domain-containing protein [Chthoniobacterales bacterium]
MSSLLTDLMAGCIFLVLAGSATSNDALPSGVMEGHLKILSSRPVELADENASTVTAENSAEYPLYPLIILSRGDKKEITRVTADSDGNYRVALPPGDYILDMQRLKHGHVRAKPQPFTIVSNRTVRVDMDIGPDLSRN